MHIQYNKHNQQLLIPKSFIYRPEHHLSNVDMTVNVNHKYYNDIKILNRYYNNKLLYIFKLQNKIWLGCDHGLPVN